MGICPSLCECQMMMPPDDVPSTLEGSSYSWFPHTRVESYVRPLFNSPLSVCLTFLPSALPYDIQLPWSSWTLHSGVYLGSASLGRKLGQQRVRCTSYHLSEAQCIAAWDRVSLKLLFHVLSRFGLFQARDYLQFLLLPLDQKQETLMWDFSRLACCQPTAFGYTEAECAARIPSGIFLLLCHV